MSSPSPSPAPAQRRSRTRRAGESAFGALLLVRMTFMGLLALLLLVAAAWSSWDTARHAVVTDGRELGTVTLVHCDLERCTGTFSATGESVVLEQRIAREPGEELAVVRRPGTDEVLRTGAAGVLYAFLPLTGALLLAAVIIGGGLRMYRTAWGVAGAGLAVLAVTFAVWI
ncbi:hypothetical protein [Streptomyces litchfieldiae]|uniref:Integral membrane protein n=1 Tax=Streptomyces litchfieldiae TaxID=3075543 RepID=A0ABU2MZC7_9ACTN|nr:hypothetical protein [Streptomyces sp. DSM 44938]MDT0346969.1 hypothetical protein [Streptomyces sp. DSM 44938]